MEVLFPSSGKFEFRTSVGTRVGTRGRPGPGVFEGSLEVGRVVPTSGVVGVGRIPEYGRLSNGAGLLVGDERTSVGRV